jgi:hypothetical protein
MTVPSLAAFCREQLTARAAQVGKTVAELAAWRREAPARGRRARTGASPEVIGQLPDSTAP